MRYFHMNRNKFHCPIINLDKICSLVPEDALAQASASKAPVVDVTQHGYTPRTHQLRMSCACQRDVPDGAHGVSHDEDNEFVSLCKHPSLVCPALTWEHQPFSAVDGQPIPLVVSHARSCTLRFLAAC